jgi:H+/Cl- antiporter ClcA
MAEDTTAPSDSPADLATVLASRGYHALLLAAGLLGPPIALIAFGFLAAVSKLEHWVWVTLPDSFGWDQPTGWYAILVLGLAGLLVGLVVAYVPGHGGHLPVTGFSGGVTTPIDLPGVVLAALASLALGTVLGPEGPLTALGGGLALLAANRTRLAQSPPGLKLLAAAGSTAAIATVLGNPLVAAVLMLEVVGFAGRQVMLVMLPCMVSAGIGSVIFTGMGSWTGIDVPSLTVSGLPSTGLDWPDLLWAVPISVLVAATAQLPRRLGLRVAAASWNTVATTILVGLLVGACGAVYHLTTDRSVLEVLQSGQAALGPLVSSPDDWSNGTLVLLLALKGLAYGVCLGAFRGGPTFPIIYLGAVLGVLVASLPGLGTTAGIAIGMVAATTAVLRLPLTSIVLVVLLLGDEATSQIPIVMLAAALAMVTTLALDRRASLTAGAAAPPG